MQKTAALVSAAAATLILPSMLHAQSLPSCPAYPNNDSIAYNTCGVAPDKTNNSKTYSDLTIQSTDAQKVISVTAIPALAGAVASIKIAGTEIIATGGHGSSFQFDAHPVFLKPSLPASACNNPTEAGSVLDPNPAPQSESPWLTPSSSLIESYSSGTGGGLPQINTKVKMAYYYPSGYDPTDCKSYWTSNGGPVSGVPSPYELTKQFTLGSTVNGTYYSSILVVKSSLSIPSAGSSTTITSTDLQMPMYLQNIFDTEIYYDPTDNYEFIKTPGEKTPSNISFSPELRIFSNSARTYAVGVMVYNGNSDPKESKPYTYTETQADNGSGGYKFRIIVPVHNYSGINPGNVVSSYSYFIFGSVSLVEGISVQFCKQWGLCS